MRFMRSTASALLWALALFALAAGALGTASVTGFARIATVSDDSAAPVAHAGSLAVAIRQDTAQIERGDFLLVGARTPGGAILGEVVEIEGAGAERSVILRAPNRTLPDQWSYELGEHSYTQQFAVPLLGYPFDYIQSHGAALPVTLFGGAALVALLVAYRYGLFAKREKGTGFWAPRPPARHLGIEEVAELFEEIGAEGPSIDEYREGVFSWKKQEGADLGEERA